MTPTNATRPLKNLGSFCRRLLTTTTPLTRITTTQRITTPSTRQYTTPSHPLQTPTNRPSPPTMPSSPNPASTPPPPSSTSHPTNPPPPTSTTTTTTAGTLPALPALPAAPENPPASGESAPQILRVDGAAVVLDHLGPMVIGRDGTVSRIANWGEMAAVERENTVRVLGRRNQVRLAALRGEEQGQGQGGEKKE